MRSFALLIAALVLAGQAFAAAPTLTHLFPAGGQRGTKVTVTCTGTFTWPPKIWAPGVDATALADSGKIDVTIPADLAADRVWIRLYDAEGASVAVPFLIGSLKEVDEVEPNEKPRAAQVIGETNVTVNGAFKDADVDCYSVQLSASQTLVAALDANTRIGSPMDSILQIVAPDGIVLAENHDDLNLDPRLAFTAPKAGTYIVRIFAFPATPNTTIRFNGGAGHLYRLTLTTGPYATHALPLSAPLSNPGTVSVAGWNIPTGTQLSIVPFGGNRLSQDQELEVLDDFRRSSEIRLGFASTPDFSIATRVRLVPSTVTMQLDAADPKRPVIAPLSSSITGCLKVAKQTDHYRIPVTKGQQLIVSAESRTLEIPLDLVMTLSDPTGKAVADVDDVAGSRDVSVVHTAALDGEYQLTIGDRFRQGGDRCWYLLTVRGEQPDFELSVSTDQIVVAPDKPTEIPVKILRRETAPTATGAIEVKVTGLPEGVTAAAVVSEPSSPTAAEVKLSFTTTGMPFSGPIQIVGKTALPQEMERFARTPARLGYAFESFWITATAAPAEKPK
ncbi:PPC domain-containing protein [Schlesneria paludicola]|uniref:PPC domain-containing protein n=1 Tax=Schlesneria paludicola TaxID=360056 RepID=UPI0006820D70|nr:PPC domain-containing protein [Schlesneria paludicola]